jgi:hypothetical protein
VKCCKIADFIMRISISYLKQRYYIALILKVPAGHLKVSATKTKIRYMEALLSLVRLVSNLLVPNMKYDYHIGIIELGKGYCRLSTLLKL